MLKRIGIGCLAVLLAGSSPSARADLNISIGSTSIAVGSTGTIPVYISSTTGTDQINDYGFKLVVQGNNSDLSQLQFSTSQDTSYSTMSPAYVFYPNSGGIVTTVPTTGSSAYLVYTQADTYGFPTDTSSVVTISTSPELLGFVTLTAVPYNSAPRPEAGDTFTVSLSPIMGNGSSDVSKGGSGDTFFNVLDSSFTETSYVSFQSTAGTITIIAAAVVPEPASTVTGLTGAFFLAAYGWLRLRRSKQQAS